ncbi:hypothetical protein GCM10020331_086280 [Ectobacillus funiculus]
MAPAASPIRDTTAPPTKPNSFTLRAVRNTLGITPMMLMRILQSILNKKGDFPVSDKNRL